MAYDFKVNREIIESVVEELKKECYIPEDSVFDHDTYYNKSNKLYYNDYGFLDALGHYRSADTVNSVLDLLKQKGIVSIDAQYPLTVYNTLSYKVKNNFIVPWKSFTPTMERLVYMLSYVKNPSNIVSIGINCGYTLAWICGTFWKREGEMSQKEVYAVDINPSLIRIAEKNFNSLDIKASVDFISGDGCSVLDTFEDEYFDMAFLDTRKNFKTLEKLYRKLKKGGWLLMHNASDPHFKPEMEKFLGYVRDKQNFSESILFNIDTKGLELSVKCL